LIPAAGGRSLRFLTAPWVAALWLAAGLAAADVARAVEAAEVDPPGFAALVELYTEFRALVVPVLRDGVPDYTPAAMRAQFAALEALRARLDAIDDRGWPIPRRADYMLVLAEMRGLEFQHRVLRPWARDPAFYSTTNLGFGPKMHGAIAIPRLPLEPEQAAELGRALEAVPAILAQARSNLVEARGDLARLGIIQKRVERNVYERLAADLAQHHPALAPAATRARDAAADFLAWLEEIHASLPPHGGVGREEYDWFLRHVMLFPYSWEEMRVIGEREYQRSMVFLKLEEHRHRALPMIEPADSFEEFERRRAAADAELLRFLREEEIMTVPEWLVPRTGEGPYILPADRDPLKPGPFDAPIQRHFFRQAEDRDPIALRAHNVPGHLYDTLLQERDTRPIRGEPRLFFVDGLRVEGWAFYVEELLQQIGIMDDRPKGREINYILQAKRAARVLPELMMQANLWTFEEALASLTSRTPYWMAPDDPIAMFDLELYLRQPGYGVGYYIGKVELEKLFAEVALAQGRDFDLKAFHDTFLAAGRMPIALIRWELTGRDDEIRRMR
jgi:uncharacterized protein (DUF885 family)